MFHHYFMGNEKKITAREKRNCVFSWCHTFFLSLPFIFWWNIDEWPMKRKSTEKQHCISLFISSSNFNEKKIINSLTSAGWQCSSVRNGASRRMIPHRGTYRLCRWYSRTSWRQVWASSNPAPPFGAVPGLPLPDGSWIDWVCRWNRNQLRKFSAL